MRWYHSIITRITLIFALALLGIGAIFFSLSIHERENTLRHCHDYAHLAVRSAFDPSSKQLDYDKLNEMGFLRIEDVKLYERILELPKPPRPFPMKQMEEKLRFGMYVVPHGMHILCCFV